MNLFQLKDTHDVFKKPLFRPTEIRKSKSLDNFRVKDDENNDKMMKSLETIQKCLQFRVGNQEQFCLNLSQINHGIHVLVGLISKNIAAKDNSTISKNAPDIPRTSNSLETDEHNETSNNVSNPWSNIKSSDSESSSDDENDKEFSNDNNCNVQKIQDCEMEVADQQNLSNKSKKYSIIKIKTKTSFKL
ncbi:unnamed protein product [Brachionus calyciflorus]|uniref:Uncharacterized protein n=1 Tax=Brachionus calyciflorus TaxID=104777 RepID=A0A813YAG5_9BILA|nr:unnamed protein product [Brachionus calyciflorus]